MMAQNQAQLAEQQRTTASAVAEQMQSRAGRITILLGDGLRVPAAVDRPYTALYVNLWLRDRPLRPEEITAWRTEFTELINHEGVVFKSTLFRDKFELARDTVLTMASAMALPSTKAEYRIWFWHIFTIVEMMVITIASMSAAEKVRKDLFASWYGDGRFDFEAALRSKEIESAQTGREETAHAASIAQLQTQIAQVLQHVSAPGGQAQHQQAYGARGRQFRGGGRRQ